LKDGLKAKKAICYTVFSITIPFFLSWYFAPTGSMPTGRLSYLLARSAYLLARSAYLLARSAYLLARSAYLLARSAYLLARSAHHLGRSTYHLSRSTYHLGRSAYLLCKQACVLGRQPTKKPKTGVFRRCSCPKSPQAHWRSRIRHTTQLVQIYSKKYNFNK
jgi:hypothetical protein